MDKNTIPKYIGPQKSNKSNKMTKDEIKHRFDNETASLYSQRDPSWLPEFTFSFSLVQRAIRPFINKNSIVADLGAGTGNLSRTILEAYPDIRIELFDFSTNMLREVKHVLSEFEGKYKTIIADIFNYTLFDNMYSAVVSSFAIHHARDDNTYKKVYENIYNALTEPGIFICCDVISGDNSFLSSLNEEDWSNFLKDQGFDKDKTDQILNNYYREDSPISMKNHLKLLLEAGFQNVDVVWKKYNFGIYAGIK